MRPQSRTTLACVLLLTSSAVASPARDIDGDGFDDAVLDHRVLYFGSAKGLVAGTAPASPRTQHVTFGALEIIGDVNGDGFADVVLGDPACPDHATDLGACEIGRAYLFLGSAKRLSATPSQTLTVADKDTHFGMELDRKSVV